MKRSSASVLVLLLCAACDSGPRVVVHASLDGRPIADLPVTLLPYDRERLQDSLREEAGDRAPALPQELLRELAGLDSALVRAARDTSARGRADSLERLREPLAARHDSLRGAVVEWEAGLRRRADSLGRRSAEEAERTPAADTTDAAGRASLRASPGQSWIRARYVLPDAVMEWNVPVTLPAGQDSLVARLDETNGRRLPLPEAAPPGEASPVGS